MFDIIIKKYQNYLKSNIKEDSNPLDIQAISINFLISQITDLHIEIAKLQYVNQMFKNKKG